MRLLHEDRRRVHRALELARDAAAYASPNPAVGCVITSPSGEVLGEGAHFYDNYDHAEIAALRQASSRGHTVRGGTAYVTLEPCSHHGRTGPCADALVSAGIARCVIATLDPNPEVRGRGVARLRAAALDTLIPDPGDELAVSARRLNDSFAFSIQHGRPFVTLKSAVSLDGCIAPPQTERTARQPVWLTGDSARADVQRLRHENDALLTGVGTILADNPALTDRTGLGRRRPLLRVILDSQLRTPPDSAVLLDSGVLVVTAENAPPERAAALEAKGAEVLRVGIAGDGLDLQAVLAALHARGVRGLMVEAGFQVNGAVLRAGLADRVVLYFADVELGQGAVPFAAGFGSPYVLQGRLSGVQRRAFANGPSEDVRISGYLHDPWAGV